MVESACTSSGRRDAGGGDNNDGGGGKLGGLGALAIVFGGGVPGCIGVNLVNGITFGCFGIVTRFGCACLLDCLYIDAMFPIAKTESMNSNANHHMV